MRRKGGTLRATSRSCCLALSLSIACAWAAAPEWPHGFTERSDAELQRLDRLLVTPDCAAAVPVPIHDRHWTEEAVDFHFIDGTLYLCPAIEGDPVWSSFHGQATVSFTPHSHAAEQDLRLWTHAGEIHEAALKEVHFFTLRGATMAKQLGVEPPPDAKPVAAPGDGAGRNISSWLGFSLLDWYLDRGGRASGTALAFFPLTDLLPEGTKNSWLLYRFAPELEQAVALLASGSQAMTANKSIDDLFYTVAEDRAATLEWHPAGTVGHYDNSLDTTVGKQLTRLVSLVTFKPTRGTRALRLSLFNELYLRSVKLGETELPFAQWSWSAGKPLLDETIVVRLPAELPAGQEVTLRFEALGRLIQAEGSYDAVSSTNVVRAEDNWYPQFDDPGGAIAELTIRCKKDQIAVAAGELVSKQDQDSTSTYRFRTTTPVTRSTFWIGEYDTKSGKVEPTTVEIYVDSSDIPLRKNIDFLKSEISTAYLFYSRLLLKIDLPVLRAVTTPTRHGRGFDGLLLLSGFQAYRGDSSNADLFRAHETAHQWFGAWIDGRDWPRDRWMTESFAEYLAMEYHLARHKDQDLWRRAIERNWYNPVAWSRSTLFERLDGKKESIAGGEIAPLSLGSDNVYDKGPLLLHSLRYLFRAMKKTDNDFWQLWRDLLGSHAHQRVSTDDFIELTEQSLGGKIPWFWDQWLYGTAIPKVKWSSQVTQQGGKWIVSVSAKQSGTQYQFPVPIYVHFSGDRSADVPLWIKPEGGSLEFAVPEKPEKITLNDNYESMAWVEK